MTKHYLFFVGLLFAGQSYGASTIENKIDWSARVRFAEFSGDESARAASLLLRATLDTRWNDFINSVIQLDDVNRAFKNEHSDGVHINGKPTIPDTEGIDLNQLYLASTMDAVTLKLGRQRINLDDQRFVGGNGFWQNEQTFDAAFSQIKMMSSSSLTYIYIGNANRIYGDDAKKYLQPNDVNYSGPESERPAALLGDHRHHSHIAQFDFNEWDYSKFKLYALAEDNITLPAASNNTIGGNFTFTQKIDALNYRLKLETAAQKQPELNGNPVLPYYLFDAGLGINHIEFNGRYEIIGNKQGANFITPLASGHDFQGLANQISNFASGGLKDASLGITWRATPFKIEARYHQFEAYTSNHFLADELDVIFSYKPNRKNTLTLLTTYFKPNLGDSTEKIYLDYAYNF